MTYGTNKVRAGYFVELLQSNFHDYTIPWLFPDFGPIPWH